MADFGCRWPEAVTQTTFPGGNTETEHHEPVAAIMAYFHQDWKEKLEQARNRPPSTLSVSNKRPDSALGFSTLSKEDGADRTRSTTPDLTASMSSLQTEEELGDYIGATSEVVLRERRPVYSSSLAHPMPIRPSTSTPLALQTADGKGANAGNSFLDVVHTNIPVEATHGMILGLSSGCTILIKSLSKEQTSSVNGPWKDVCTACDGPLGSHNALQMGFQDSNLEGSQPAQANGISNHAHPYPGGEDPRIMGDGDADELSEVASDGLGFSCVFHTGNSSRDPTQFCSKRRKFVSQLKKHHCHGDHPGGPFCCCQKCFVTGYPRQNASTGAQEFVRFKNLTELKAHEKTCGFYVCIQEGCVNYDRVPDDDQPCPHDTKYTGRQIWRMWLKRAHDLNGTTGAAEVSHNTAIPATTSTTRVPHLLASSPSTPFRPRSGASSVQSFSRFSDDRSRTSMTSPALDPPTGFSSPFSASISSQSGLESFARKLLERVQTGNFSWSDTSSQLYNSTMRAASIRCERIADTEPDEAERIQSTRILIGLCRNILTNASSRTMSNWSDLRDAAAVALLMELPSRPTNGWLSSEEHGHSPSLVVPNATQLGPQMANFGGIFGSSLANNASAPEYPATLELQDEGMSAFNVGTNVQNRAHAHAAGDSFAQNTLDPRRLSAGWRIGAGADSQSSASAPFEDSGVYSGDGSSEYSGNGKSPVSRRPPLLRHWQGSS